MNWNRCPESTGTGVRNELESVSGMAGIPNQVIKLRAPGFLELG